MTKAHKSGTKHLRQNAEKLLNKMPQGLGLQLSEVETAKLIHELEVHQIELEMQNEELILARSAQEDISSKYIELYDFAPLGYFTLSRKGNITELNLNGASMLSKERSLLINRLFSSFVSRDTRSAFNQFLENVFNSNVKEECEVILSNNGNLPIHVLLTGIASHDGKHCKLTVVDITNRKKTEEALFRLNEELRRSNKELEQFAYVASHDLQEPLRMVSSFTQLLARRYKDKLDETAQQYIHFAVDGANRSQDLINDLLKYSRVGTRGKKFSMVDFNKVTQYAIDNLAIRINEKQAKVTCDELPTVTGDEGQLVQLLQNMLENALKFCQRAPKVHISAKEGPDHYVFSVRDNGIGIEQQYSEKIFLIFQRLFPREEYEGSGIGLAICKRIVERHGGNICFESEEGKGTTFHFTIAKQQRI